MESKRVIIRNADWLWRKEKGEWDVEEWIEWNDGAEWVIRREKSAKGKEQRVRDLIRFCFERLSCCLNWKLKTLRES